MADTTESILEQLQKSPLENIVVMIGENRFLIPTAIVKLIGWNAIPDAIKDENSEAAKKFATARVGIKALIRPFLPEILRKTWGKEVTITPRLNILNWLPSYFLHYFINLVASKEWHIHVEPCEGCGQHTYKVLGISPNARVTDSGETTDSSSSTDRQPA